jgi:hypothetical protein
MREITGKTRFIALEPLRQIAFSIDACAPTIDAFTLLRLQPKGGGRISMAQKSLRRLHVVRLMDEEGWSECASVCKPETLAGLEHDASSDSSRTKMLRCKDAGRSRLGRRRKRRRVLPHQRSDQQCIMKERARRLAFVPSFQCSLGRPP